LVLTVTGSVTVATSGVTLVRTCPHSCGRSDSSVSVRYCTMHKARAAVTVAVSALRPTFRPLTVRPRFSHFPSPRDYVPVPFEAVLRTQMIERHKSPVPWNCIVSLITIYKVLFYILKNSRYR
jgi:hypothetical protein